MATGQEIKKIKYFKTTCQKCKEEYTINLELCEQPLHCYKCSRELKIPELEMERIEATNQMLAELSKDYTIEPDGDGLVISRKPIRQAPAVSISPPSVPRR